jgi:hypothetical protein
MALTIVVQQVVEEENGLYSVYVQFFDDQINRVLGKTVVQGRTKDELKNALRPKWEKALAAFSKKPNLVKIAQEAANELMAE